MRLRDNVKQLLGYPMKEIEQALIDAALDQTDGCVAAAAAILGMNVRTLYRRIARYSEGD